MSTWDEKPEPTVDSIREELRYAIFDCVFWGGGFKIEGREEESEIARQKASVLVVFGVNNKLINPQEGNDWLDVIMDRNPNLSLAEVAQKYIEESKNDVD